MTNANAPRALRAGSLQLLFADCAITHLAVGGVEVVQSIYAAVRDSGWETVPLSMSNLAVDDRGDSFAVSFEAEHVWRDVDFSWSGKIEGFSDSRLVFSFSGCANTAFKKNRIGFCCLYPLSCAGAACEVVHGDGSVDDSAFPRYVSPHQPFFSIKTLRYRLPGVGMVTIEFEGDEFEMEDQRNWTDSSFKTYCTPLSLPFPVVIAKGETVVQRITVKVDQENAAKKPEQAVNKDVKFSNQPFRLPRLGLTWAENDDPALAGQLVKALAPELLCLEADARSSVPANWRQRLAAAAATGETLFLHILLPDDNSGEAVQQVTKLFPETSAVSWEALFIPPLQKLADADWLQPFLSATPAGVRVGVGTARHFAELNRNRPHPGCVDFISFSANPQVHRFDDASVMENIPGLSAALRDGAATFADGKEVALASLTLRNRIVDDPVDSGPDPRQADLFGAAWLAASVAELARGGAAAAILLAALTGGFGVAENSGAKRYFPLFHLLRRILPYSGGTLFPLDSCGEGVAATSSRKIMCRTG